MNSQHQQKHVAVWSTWIACSAIVGCIAQPAPTWRGQTDRGEDLEETELPVGEAPKVLPSAPPRILPPAAPVPEGEVAAAQSGELVQPDQPASCGASALVRERQTIPGRGHVLVIFDRSASMEDDWEEVPKQQVAGRALITALAPLADQLEVGGIFFPSEELEEEEAEEEEEDASERQAYFWGFGDCTVNAIESVDQLDFMPAARFMQQLPQRWYTKHSTGTPLEASIQRAAEAVQSRRFDDPLTLIIVTDGKPNCDTDEDRVLAQVRAFRKAGISTYVVGLPGAEDAAEFLGALAQAGGTALYIEPRDPRELEQHLRGALQPKTKEAFPSCSFQLDPDTGASDTLHVYATEAGAEREVMMPAADGGDMPWRFDADSGEVILQGALCERAQSGELEGLRFVFDCEPPPLPAPPPPEPELF
ncbi:MAG: vWA domain-containing protein [Polyangiales bacterium]